MKAVFLDRETIDASIDLSGIEKLVSELDVYATTPPDQVVSRSLPFDIIITNKVKFDANRFAQLPNLKLICITATGTDNVYLDAAKKAGVKVTNVSGYSTESVAQHVFAYLLNVVNNVPFYLTLNQEKPWHQSETFCQIHAPVNELAGKTIGIIGYGNLGQRVARISEAFGLQVLVAERQSANSIRPGRISFVELIAAADIISLHCPLNAETVKLFDEKIFAKMKKGSIFINTARGGIVDAKALACALKSGHLGHAIVDVLEAEPPAADHPLLQADVPNLTLTHHIAWGSIQAQRILIEGVAENIRCFNQNLVN
jgi:glycerate dehydrogenase